MFNLKLLKDVSRLVSQKKNKKQCYAFVIVKKNYSQNWAFLFAGLISFRISFANCL